MNHSSVTTLLTAALTTVFLLAAPTVHAQTSRVYGDITATLLEQRFNPDYLNAAALADADTMVANLRSNFYLTISEPKLGSAFLDISIDSTLTTAGTSDMADIGKRSSIAVRQFFLLAPLVEAVFMTAGIKTVSAGYASFFNVSNRLSPRQVSGMEQGEENPGLVQLDWYPAEFLNLSGILYFLDKTDWSKKGLMAALRLQLDPLNADVYGYLENQENPFLGYNASVQLGPFKLYAEGLLGRQEQLSLTAAPDSLPAVPDPRGIAISQAAGLTLDTDTANFTLEYLYRSEGLADIERTRLRDYLSALPDAGSRASALSSCYGQNSWDSHYLAFSATSRLMDGRINASAQLMGGAGEDPTDWYDSAGLFGSLMLTFNPSTSLHLSAFVQHAFGGRDSEYILYNPGSLLGGLAISYAFSTQSF